MKVKVKDVKNLIKYNRIDILAKYWVKYIMLNNKGITKKAKQLIEEWY